MTTRSQTDNRCAFPLLAEPQRYVRCMWNLRENPTQQAYWLELFREHFPRLEAAAVRVMAQSIGQDQATLRARRAHEHFFAYLHNIERDETSERLDILDICIAREAALRAAGIDDAYAHDKSSENIAAMKVLPQLLMELDALDELSLAARVMEGVFAGNIFDLGATDTAKMFEQGGVDFHAVRSKLKPRPWLFDDFDPWLKRMTKGKPYQRAVLFVDNAGSDIVLGMIPFARYLLQRGTRVVLTANELPSLNDVTIDELKVLIEQIAAWDNTLAEAIVDGRIEMVSSGNGLPLIDLADVSCELAEACRAKPVDLVVLEGMGRGVESNLKAKFTCDVLKIAMVKDQGVADGLGGSLFDLVFRYDQTAD